MIWHVWSMPARGFDDRCDDKIVSAHIFSLDGRTWRSHPTPPYTSQVLMENGKVLTVATRERPKIYFVSGAHTSHTASARAQAFVAHANVVQC